MEAADFLHMFADKRHLESSPARGVSLPSGLHATIGLTEERGSKQLPVCLRYYRIDACVAARMDLDWAKSLWKFKSVCFYFTFNTCLVNLERRGERIL